MHSFSRHAYSSHSMQTYGRATGQCRKSCCLSSTGSAAPAVGSPGRLLRCERATGAVGLRSSYLVITYIVLITGGYASGQWSAVLSTIWF
jgi:hypothetical protein